MALNLAKTVQSFLKDRAEQKFTARQIAQWIFDTYPEECQIKKANSTFLTSDAELITQLAAEIGARRPQLQGKQSEIKTTEGRPRKYYYSDKSDSSEVAEAESIETISNGKKNSSASKTLPSQSTLNEHALYPLLGQYLHDEFGVYAKRIDEKRSSNKRGPNGNRWLYPDVVGMEDLGADWHQEVRDCVNQYSDKRTKLWSFEAKLLINRSNVRECFFQAVSNSSWANFGYLVAAEIEGIDTIKELRMLSAAHGIGVLKLDSENPSESQVLIPARESKEIDWDTANRLAKENADFLTYLKLVKQFYQTGEARDVDWIAKAGEDQA